MEKIIEFGGDIDEEKEVSTSASAVNVIVNSTDTQHDNKSIYLSCDTSQRRCYLPEELAAVEYSARIANDSSEADRANASRPIYNFKLTMLLQYSKEFLGFLALILTTYATLLNKEPIIGGAISPKPIFAKDSLVQEWPYGHLIDVQSKVAVSELSLIFFYAPWCAESLFAKKVYNAMANLYSREVYFAAVNCWQPGSGCRTNYSNVYKWPILMAYFPSAFSVQYNGDWSYTSLTNFIDGLLTPLVRINNVEELMQLRIANDAIVFGVFTSCDSKEYQIYFQTAVKWLESNSFQNIKFAIYTGEQTSMFLQSEYSQPPVIKLFTTNETIVYNNAKWVSKKIINFLRQSTTKSNIWINLPGTKSATMYKHLQRGPVLLMFSPRVSTSHHYFIMKQIIYSHKNYQHGLNNTVLNSYINHIQREYPVRLKKLNEFCELAKKAPYHDIQTALYDVGVWGDKLFSLGMQTVNTSKHMSSNPHLSAGRSNCNYKYCEGQFYRHDVYQKAGGVKPNLDRLDYRSPSEMLRSHLEKQCIHLEKLPQALFQKALVEPINPSKFLGPENAQNQTLTFLMLDSMVYSDYLRSFIGDHETYQHPSSSPALFIVENNAETLYMQKGPISTKNAMEFVDNFYKGKLNRHLRSSQVAKIHNTSMNSNANIKEINSQQFSKVIHWTNVTSVVLFYSPQCSFCYIMSHALLEVSYLMNLSNIAFYRLDGTANDVCWEYTMDKYPTLIVFPQNRSIETYVFPTTIEINVKNVFGFILSKLRPKQQLKSLINACTLTKLSTAFQSCVRYAREMVNNEIYRNLNRWDRSPSHRTYIFKQLKTLKEVYLELMRARIGPDLEHVLRYYNI